MKFSFLLIVLLFASCKPPASNQELEGGKKPQVVAQPEIEDRIFLDIAAEDYENKAFFKSLRDAEGNMYYVGWPSFTDIYTNGERRSPKNILDKLVIIKKLPNGEFDRDFGQGRGQLFLPKLYLRKGPGINPRVRSIMLDNNSLYIAGGIEMSPNPDRRSNIDGFVMKLELLTQRLDPLFGNGDGDNNDGLLIINDQNTTSATYEAKEEDEVFHISMLRTGIIGLLVGTESMENFLNDRISAAEINLNTGSLVNRVGPLANRSIRTLVDHDDIDGVRFNANSLSNIFIADVRGADHDFIMVTKKFIPSYTNDVSFGSTKTRIESVDGEDIEVEYTDGFFNLTDEIKRIYDHDLSEIKLHRLYFPSVTKLKLTGQALWENERTPRNFWVEIDVSTNVMTYQLGEFVSDVSS